ncbi:pentapeptide repeat-containing protein [Streptomyces sp. NPDC050535]|uniref:pentapeptide repeat-containing protein n=1 Tax=Streptomyces sp. NPDC050535 TaxID=3365626 RepID=UPI0037888B1A
MELRKVWPAVMAVLGVAGLAGVLVMMFTPLSRRLARWLAGQDWSSMDAAARSAAVGQVRLAVVQVVAAVGAGIALVYTARSYRLSRRGQVTDRFTKALERLGSAESYVCIGGVLALEQIVQDAPDQGRHAARVLNALVRDRTQPAGAPGGLASVRLPEEPGEMVQEALRALTAPGSRRRGGSWPPVDLAGRHLAKAQLPGADLRRALLQGVTLSSAVLCRAQLDGADLADADLAGADLSDARGLTVEQVLAARGLHDCVLPEPVRSDARVAERVSRGE